MNNACTSRWCRRSRIITKRQWRRFEKHPMRLFWWLTGIITGIFILCIIFAGRSETAYTAFGSYFTALAFVGVIVTVLLQRAELQEQRKELRAQRIELEGQKRELEIQNCTAQLQRFENGFFHLLDNFKTILEESRNSHLMMSFKPSQGLLTPYTIIEKEYDINEDIQTFIATLFINLPISLKKLVRTYYAIIDFIYTHDAFKNKKYDYSKYTNYIFSHTMLFWRIVIFLYARNMSSSSLRRLLAKTTRNISDGTACKAKRWKTFSSSEQPGRRPSLLPSASSSHRRTSGIFSNGLLPDKKAGA